MSTNKFWTWMSFKIFLWSGRKLGWLRFPKFAYARDSFRDSYSSASKTSDRTCSNGGHFCLCIRLLDKYIREHVPCFRVLINWSWQKCDLSLFPTVMVNFCKNTGCISIMKFSQGNFEPAGDSEKNFVLRTLLGRLDKSILPRNAEIKLNHICGDPSKIALKTLCLCFLLKSIKNL